MSKNYQDPVAYIPSLEPVTFGSEGLTKLELFTLHCGCAILSNSSVDKLTPDDIATDATNFAFAMLQRLELIKENLK